MIGLISIINGFLPIILYNSWVNFNRSEQEEVYYALQKHYDWGWQWIESGSLLVWGVPASLWFVDRVTRAAMTDEISVPIILIDWWTQVLPYATPIFALVGFGSMAM